MNEGLQKLKSVHWSGPLITSVASILIVSAVIIIGLPSVISAVAAPSWDGQSEDIFAALENDHDRQAEISARRFQGRSPFVVPSRPRTRPAAPRTETPKPRPRVEAPKVETGPPKNYTGPDPIGVAGPFVFFSPNTQILVGEEDNGVEVIAILSATRVKLGHKGGEYEVSFLKADPESIFTPFKSLNSSSVLGRAAASAIRPVPPVRAVRAVRDTEPVAAAIPVEPAADATPDAGNSDGNAAEPWTPSQGSQVTVTFNDGDVTRSLTGNLEYLTGSGSARNMVIRGTIDGRTVYQRINGAQLLTIDPADPTERNTPRREEDPTSEAPAEEMEETEETEVVEEISETIDPSTEANIRGLSYAELSALNLQLAERLESSDISEQIRADLEIEIRLVNELLRETPPEG